MPAIHSSVPRRVSLAKSWRCVTSHSRTYFSLWSGPWELRTMTFSVMFSMVRSFMGGILALEGSIVTGLEDETLVNGRYETCYKEKEGLWACAHKVTMFVPTAIVGHLHVMRLLKADMLAAYEEENIANRGELFKAHLQPAVCRLQRSSVEALVHRLKLRQCDIKDFTPQSQWYPSIVEQAIALQVS